MRVVHLAKLLVALCVAFVGVQVELREHGRHVVSSSLGREPDLLCDRVDCGLVQLPRQIPNDAVEFNALDTGAFVNNIVQGGGDVWVASGAVVREDYNLFSGAWINVGGGPHDLKANPGFVDAAGGDFHLAVSSPAIDSGDNGTIVSPVRPYDFDGDPVIGIVDRGAYEY